MPAPSLTAAARHLVSGGRATSEFRSEIPPRSPTPDPHVNDPALVLVPLPSWVPDEKAAVLRALTSRPENRSPRCPINELMGKPRPRADPHLPINCAEVLRASTIPRRATRSEHCEAARVAPNASFSWKPAMNWRSKRLREWDRRCTKFCPTADVSIAQNSH